MLVAELIRRQQELGLSDARFAKLLEIDRTTWLKTRRGEIPARLFVLRGAVRAFPDLSDMTLAELAKRNGKEESHEIAV